MAIVKGVVVLIQAEFYNDSQSWNLVQITKHGDVKLRVRIKRNFYDAQSFAVVEQWYGTSWHEVVRSHIAECKCHSVSSVDRNPARSLFQADADELIRKALEVLS